MKKKIIAVVLSVLCLVSLINPIHPHTAQATKYDSYYDDYKRSISSRCSELQGYLKNAGEKQYGLLFRLRILTEYMMYTDFLIEYKDTLHCGNEAVIYEMDLSNEVKAFNKLFSKNSKLFKKCTLNENFTGIDKTAQKKSAHAISREAFRDNLFNRIPKYLDTLLSAISDDITQANGNVSKIDKIKKDNTTLLSNIYSVYVAVKDAKSDLKSFTPFKTDGSHEDYDLSQNGKTIGATFKEVLNKFPDLIKIAKKAQQSEETREDITLDLTKAYVDNLSDAVTTSTGVEIPKDPSLSLLYYAIMSASSVYVPLQSYAGCSEFQAALKSLTNDDQVQAQMVEFYSAVKDIRKPLYKREFDDKGIPTGTAKLITINDFINDIKNDNSGALCTVLGKFDYDKDSGSWLYYQNDFRTNIGADYDAPEDNSQSEIGVSDNTENINDAVSTVEPSSSPAPATGVSFSQSYSEQLKQRVGCLGLTKVAVAATASPSPSSSPDPNGTTNYGVEESEDCIKDTAVFAYDEITDETKLSEAIYMYGSDYFRDIDNSTAVLLKNALNSSANLKYLSDSKSRYLYVNAFGDIVTDDNLIIFPGVANPTLYKNTENYNPYTAAFMNSYPMCYKKSNTFKLTNKNDIGKYIIVKQTKNSSGMADGFYAVKTRSINAIKASEPIQMKPLYLNFSSDGSSTNKLMDYTELVFGSSTSWNESNESYLYRPLTQADSAKVNMSVLFPYVVAEDKNFEAAKVIAKNMYLYLTTDLKTGAKSVRRLNDNFIIHYFILNGVEGTNNPKGYTRNSLEEYEKFVQDAPARFLSKVKGLSDNIIEFTSKAQGVIGLRDSLQNPILGRILVFCRTNLLFFILIVSLILIYVFIKAKLDLFRATVKFVFSIVVAYLFITLVPTYLPMLFNVAINEVAENLTYRILGIQTEDGVTQVYDEELNSDGESKFNSESITLYRAGVLNYEHFVNTLNVDEQDIVGGNITILNRNAGTFAEGDSIKINTSTLFKTLKIAADKDSKDDAYRIKAYKTVSNNVDYYTPFYQFVDSYIDELNKMEKVYDIPRSTITYVNGVIKDNFLVYSFANSPVFLSPGEYGERVPQNGLSDERLEELQATNDELARDLTKTFGEKNVANDFLRMHEWLDQPTAAMKKTLWYQTMVKNGFYSSDGTAKQKKIDDLVTHVNYQTRRFIFSMDKLIGKMSDETMIKLIALRADVDFNQQISDFGNWVYPFSLNYGDFTLKDVAGCVFISDYNKYTAMNLDLVEYVGETKGWFNLIMMDLLIIMLFLVCYAVQFAIPILYVLLCCLIVFKLLAQSDAKVPVKGFAKCSAVIMVCYTLFAVGLVLVEKADGSVVGIYGMLGVCILIAYLMFFIVSCVIANLVDLGNTSFNVKVKSFSPTSLKQGFKNIRANRIVGTHSDTKRHKKYVNDKYQKYGYDSDIYSMYRPNSGNDYYGDSINTYSNPVFSDEDGESGTESPEPFDYSKVYDNLDFPDSAGDDIVDSLSTQESTEQEFKNEL